MSSTSFVNADGEVSFSMKRNFGIGIGSNIQGRFTIHCSSSDEIEIVEMRLFFNGTKVASTTESIFSFLFNTDDYPFGSTNITLIGYTSEGIQYQVSQIYNYLSPTSRNLVFISILVFIVLMSFFKYFKGQRS